MFKVGEFIEFKCGLFRIIVGLFLVLIYGFRGIRNIIGWGFECDFFYLDGSWKGLFLAVVLVGGGS